MSMALSSERPLNLAPAAATLAPAPAWPQRLSISPRVALRTLIHLSVIALPLLIAALYVFWLAEPQYLTEVQFAVRGAEGAEGSSRRGLLAAFSSGAEGAFDGYAVRAFLESADALAQLETRTGYARRMGKGQRDPLYRLPDQPDLGQLLKHYRRMVSVHYSIMKQIVEIRVHAFAPEDSEAIASELLTLAEEFANRMNERARRDLLRTAQEEVERAERLLAERSHAVNAWRTRSGNIDPTRFAEMVGDSIGRLELALIEARAQLAEADGISEQRSARHRQLELRIAALSDQITEERQRLTGSIDSAADQMLAYERLLLEQSFAQRTYESAAEALASARYDLSRQQKFVSVIVSPRVVQTPDWPDPPRLLAVVLLASLLSWWLASLIGATIRDAFYG
jgi:capsular polysaccharide transport system permease protein